MTDVPTAHVVLAPFPLRLFAAAEEQWESMLREYALRGIGGAIQAYDNGEVTRAANALAAVGAAAATFGDAAGQGTMHLDVSAPTDFALLQGILDDALALAASGELLAVPPSPDVVAFRHWLCDQVLSQAAGAPAEPWRFVPVGLPASEPEA